VIVFIVDLLNVRCRVTHRSVISPSDHGIDLTLPWEKKIV